MNEDQIIVGSGRSSHTIHPYIFGSFIEDIDDHMTAMLAYPLRSMDFEEEDQSGNGVSGPWYPLNSGKHTQYALEPAAKGHGGHSQKVRLYNKDRCQAGIGQKIQLEAGIPHKLRIVMRATREIASLQVKLVDTASQEVLGAAEIAVTGHRWFEAVQLLDVARASRSAELQVWAVPLPAAEWEDSVSTGMIWFDHISLLPEQDTGLLKAEVFAMAKRLNSGIMRLGGNYISLYHWDDFVGETDLRPNYINEAWEQAGQVHKYFGTDEFIALCRLLGVEPQICVNMGTGSAQEAADWVEYCNGAADTPMGALRAQNGFPSPYNVKYWEIGNEMYGPWQAGVCSAEQYAKTYLAFAEAMRDKDVSIRLLGCGTAREDLVPGWNRTVLELAGQAMDYVTLHIYQGQNFFPIHAKTPPEERFRAIMAFPEVVRELFGQLEAIIQESEKLQHLKIAVTEWNTMYFPNPDLANAHTLEAALANACLLHEMIRQSHLVEIGNFSDLVNGWVGGCIRVGDSYERMKKPGWSGRGDVVFGTATYHMLKLYANLPLHRVVDTTVDCRSFHPGPAKVNLASKSLSELDVVACVSETGDTLTLCIVNRSLKPIPLSVNFSSWPTQGTARLHTIASSHYEDCNTVDEPEKVKAEVISIGFAAGIWQYDLQPHAIYALEVALSAF
ncbi:alpha-L-arabinofuranosidase C-terminal domain-containing protein [Paenibacillus ferrarius]|uniref:alpha-L-arabinofuranosidase C-terminal domain-containing protein n=1 Tax=Paenibacillus ferrarius TaxID=1469647 RepID=UPI003D293D29